MPRCKKLRAAAVGGTILVPAAVAAVIASWDVPGDEPSPDRTSMTRGGSPPLGDSAASPEPEPAPTAFARTPETRAVDVTGEGVPSALSGSESSPGNPVEGGDTRDSEPFIDPDVESGDYTYAPASEVGHFIDPDAY